MRYGLPYYRRLWCGWLRCIKSSKFSQWDDDDDDDDDTAEMATSKKTAKYAGLTSDYHFQPISVDGVSWPCQWVSCSLPYGAWKENSTTDRRRAWDCFLFLRLSVLVQRFDYVFTILLLMMTARINPFNASCSKLLLFEGFSAILV